MKFFKLLFGIVLVLSKDFLSLVEGVGWECHRLEFVAGNRNYNLKKHSEGCNTAFKVEKNNLCFKTFEKLLRGCCKKTDAKTKGFKKTQVCEGKTEKNKFFVRLP